MTLPRVLTVVGRTLVALGAVLLLFIAFELWGTDLQQSRAQENLESDFLARLQQTGSDVSGGPAPLQAPNGGQTLPHGLSEAGGATGIPARSAAARDAAVDAAGSAAGGAAVAGSGDGTTSGGAGNPSRADGSAGAAAGGEAAVGSGDGATSAARSDGAGQAGDGVVDPAGGGAANPAGADGSAGTAAGGGANNSGAAASVGGGEASTRAGQGADSPLDAWRLVRDITQPANYRGIARNLDPEVEAMLPLVYPTAGSAVARISIPAIGVQEVVVAGVGVDDLRKGPGHFSTTSLPGQPGNAAIAGHRTTYGAPFGRINELRPGDRIIVQTLQGTFTYQVLAASSLSGGQSVAAFIVAPTALEVLDDYGDNRLTLVSCHPKYSSRERIIVQAALVSEPVVRLPRPDGLDIRRNTTPATLPDETPPESAAGSSPESEAAAGGATAANRTANGGTTGADSAGAGASDEAGGSAGGGQVDGAATTDRGSTANGGATTAAGTDTGDGGPAGDGAAAGSDNNAAVGDADTTAGSDGQSVAVGGSGAGLSGDGTATGAAGSPAGAAGGTPAGDGAVPSGSGSPMTGTAAASGARTQLDSGFGEGLGGDRDAIAPAVLWALAAAAVWGLAWALGRSWHRWKAYAIAVAPFLVVLYLAFSYIDRALPAY